MESQRPPRQSEAIVGDRGQSEAIVGDRGQSEAIRSNRRRSEAITTRSSSIEIEPDLSPSKTSKARLNTSTKRSEAGSALRSSSTSLSR